MTPNEILMVRQLSRYAGSGASQYVAFTRDSARHVADGRDFLRVRELAEEHAEEGEATIIIDVDCVTYAGMLTRDASGNAVVMDSGVVWRSDGGAT